MARKRKVIVFGIVILLGAFVVRASILYYNTTQLVRVSNQFPREYTVGSGSDEITYIALGDSTVQGAGCASLEQTMPYLIAKQLASQGYKVKVINRGVVGATIADVENYQLEDIDKLHADFISLNIGSNDATHYTDYIEFDKHMLNVLEKITKNPSTTVAVATSPDLSLVPAMKPGYCDLAAWRALEQNKILGNIIGGSSVHRVDLYTDGKLDGMDNYASDEFHPSAQGYAKWAKLFSPVTQLVNK